MKGRIAYDRIIKPRIVFPRPDVCAGEHWWRRWEKATGKIVSDELRQDGLIRPMNGRNRYAKKKPVAGTVKAYKLRKQGNGKTV